MSKEEYKEALISNIPNYYKTSTVFDNLIKVDALELDNINTKIDNVFNQFFIDTADFALERWEQELGIPVNLNYNIDYRRAVITSKLRGQGTITIKLIKTVAQSFAYGAVDIIENNADYSFLIKFVDTRGVPPNLDDLKNAIEEIKPAHLAVVYDYTYTTWDEIANVTWDKLTNYTWDDIMSRRFV